MIKRIFVITIVFINFTGVLIAQNFVNVYSKKPGLDYVVEKIDFLDESTKEVINSFDVEKHNPFKYLDKYLTTNYSHNLRDFDLKEANIRLIDLQSNLEGYEEVLDGNLKINLAKLMIKISSERYQRNPNYKLVCYTLYIYDFYPTAYNSKLFILNKIGDVVTTISTNNSLNDYAITENGKYFVYSHGARGEFSVGRLIDYGYTIYSITDKKVIHIEELDQNITGMDNIENLIQIRLKHELGNEFVFLDIDKKKKYSKVLSNADKIGLKNITKDGMVFDYGIESFEDSFEIEEFIVNIKE